MNYTFHVPRFLRPPQVTQVVPQLSSPNWRGKECARVRAKNAVRLRDLPHGESAGVRRLFNQGLEALVVAFSISWAARLLEKLNCVGIQMKELNEQDILCIRFFKVTIELPLPELSLRSSYYCKNAFI